MNIVIIGCGKTGARLASELDELGFDVAVIDAHRRTFQFLNRDFSGLCIKGNAGDIDTLRNAGCEHADVAVVTTDNDNLNIMVAEILKVEFDIENVYLRIGDPARETVFRKFGMRTICPTRLESDVFLSFITDAAEEIDSIRLSGSSIRFTMEKCNKRDIDSELSSIKCKTGKMPFALRRKDGSLHFANEADLFIEEGDKIVYAII